MSDAGNQPVATLAGVTLPGDHRPVDGQALRENVSVLRQSDGAWRRVSPSPGMSIHAGDVIHLKGEAFSALGARAFAVEDGAAGIVGTPPPPHLQLAAHEATHVVQQRGATVTPVNGAEAEAIERAAAAVEEMVLPRPAGGP